MTQTSQKVEVPRIVPCSGSLKSKVLKFVKAKCLEEYSHMDYVGAEQPRKMLIVTLKAQYDREALYVFTRLEDEIEREMNAHLRRYGSAKHAKVLSRFGDAVNVVQYAIWTDEGGLT